MDSLIYICLILVDFYLQVWHSWSSLANHSNDEIHGLNINSQKDAKMTPSSSQFQWPVVQDEGE